MWRFVVLNLRAAGWDYETHSIASQAKSTPNCSGAPTAGCGIDFELMLARRRRANCVKKQQAVFFNYLGLEAREILEDLRENYVSDSELQMVVVRKHLPDVLKVWSISDRGNVNEIIKQFGGVDQLRSAVNQIHLLLNAT